MSDKGDSAETEDSRMSVSFRIPGSAPNTTIGWDDLAEQQQQQQNNKNLYKELPHNRWLFSVL